ncbi:unnamed protein product, partial [Didymodactylos carnosus]
VNFVVVNSFIKMNSIERVNILHDPVERHGNTKTCYIDLIYVKSKQELIDKVKEHKDKRISLFTPYVGALQLIPDVECLAAKCSFYIYCLADAQNAIHSPVARYPQIEQIFGEDKLHKFLSSRTRDLCIYNEDKYRAEGNHGLANKYYVAHQDLC